MDTKNPFEREEETPRLTDIFAEETHEEEASVEDETSVKDAPVAETSVEDEPVEDASAEEAPADEETLAEEEPSEDAPLDDEEISLDELLAMAEAAPEKRPKKLGFLADLYDWLEVFAISVAAVFVLFAFVVRVAVVDGDSMTDTLHHGEKLLVLELFYTPKQGDIIVCQDDCPELGFDNPIVKRVIATAGQTITMDSETWTVTVDGVPLDEDYVRYLSGRPMGDWDYGESYTVPEGYVFVMGDNRTGSWDSRDDAIGPIDERYVIGKVIFRFAPFDSFGPVS